MCKNRGHNTMDECLGMLNGVANACCGHGKNTEAYVQFLDGSVVRGEDAVTIQRIIKDNSVQEFWNTFKRFRVSDFEIARINNEKYSEPNPRGENPNPPWV